jgi:hypothetical protein
LQKEMNREVPVGFVPLKQDKRPRSTNSDISVPQTENKRDLI